MISIWQVYNSHKFKVRKLNAIFEPKHILIVVSSLHYSMYFVNYFKVINTAI